MRQIVAFCYRSNGSMIHTRLNKDFLHGRYMKYEINGFPLCLFLAIFWTSVVAATESVLPTPIGKPVAFCDFKSLDSSASTDTTSLKGKVIYIDFWASWCAPCAKSFPFLNALEKEYGDRGLVVLGVSVDEKVTDAQTFLKRHPAVFKLAIDSNGTCPKAFGVAGMPSSYLVDRHGIVREVHLGFREEDTANRRMSVDRLLNESD